LEEFRLIYELKGCQKAINYLTDYYEVRKMKIVLNGRKVGNKDVACYSENRAYFTKRSLRKIIILHEVYHHIISIKKIDLPERIEEKEANLYSLKFFKEEGNNFT
jgi:hypothetical protein